MAKDQREERPEPNGQPEPTASQAPAEETAPKRRATRSRRTTQAAEASAPETAPEANGEAEAPARPARRRSRAKAAEEAAPAADAAPAEEAAPKRRRTRRTAEPVPVPVPTEAPEPAARQEPPGELAEPARQEPKRQEPQRQHQGDPSGEPGSRKRKRNKKKNKGGGGQPGQSGQPGQHPNGGGGNGHPGEPFVGMLEMIGDKNFGFIREVHPSLPKGDNDAFMPPPLIDKYKLRDGVILEGFIKPGRKGAWQVSEVTKVMNGEPEKWKDYPIFDEGVTIYPNEKLNLVTGPADISMRVVDLVAPIGKGQRALLVAPPRAGKTIILKQMARSLAQNHPEVKLVALLIDERPEEVTDFRRNTEATVFASSNDYQEDNHIRVATLAFEYCRRMVEMGHDVVLLLDSLTRLGRTFNLWGGNSGRTMSGGLDARALLMPRKIFGAARNIENGGSLTIVATALIETGSRMDDVIFEEFKGTGNAEIVLDRELADKRIYPAINLRKSGTRNVEQIIGMELVQYHNMLMRALNSRHPVDAMQALIRHIMSSPDNVHLMAELIPSDI
jgi:transcription termination factor Rho